MIWSIWREETPEFSNNVAFHGKLFSKMPFYNILQVGSRATYLDFNVFEELTTAWDLLLRGCFLLRTTHPLHQKPDSDWELFLSVQERSTGPIKHNIHDIIQIKKVENQDSLYVAFVIIQKTSSLMHLTKVAKDCKLMHITFEAPKLSNCKRRFHVRRLFSLAKNMHIYSTSFPVGTIPCW